MMIKSFLDCNAFMNHEDAYIAPISLKYCSAPGWNGTGGTGYCCGLVDQIEFVLETGSTELVLQAQTCLL